MSLRKVAAAAALLGASLSAHAAVTIFSDNFDADQTTNNATRFVHGWTVTDGTVDVDGTGFVHNEMPGNGHYVDLDGSTKHSFSFHNLGGDNRGAFLHQVTVSAVPEINTYAMLLAGLACVGLAARRRERQERPF